MIIDGHTHIFSLEVRKGRKQYCQLDPAFKEIYGSEKARMIGPDSLIEAMDEAGVDMAVVCGFPWGNHDLCVSENDAILEAVWKYPSRLVGFCSIDPTVPDRAETEIERCVAEGLKGVGELGFYHRRMTSEDSARMEPISGEGRDRSQPDLPVCHFLSGDDDHPRSLGRRASLL
jgi:predicted TIM-barrel fold metal-dependent hydrolase